MRYSLLINPLSRGAFFAEYVDIACLEVEHVLGVTPTLRRIGELTFLEIEYTEDLTEICRLSTVQGIFENRQGLLVPCDVDPKFHTPRGLVFGAKYPGKTHEVLTQLAINLALAHSAPSSQSPSLLDPMAGRGTTLLWASRYGIDADGLELDPKAIIDFQREVKKQTKLEKIKHNYSGGRLPHLKKSSDGSFSEFRFKESASRLIQGDSRDLAKFVGQKRRYTLIVSDLPYGVQHFAGKERSPLNSLQDCAVNWVRALRAGGAMVLIFNSFLPKRHEIVGLFEPLGLNLAPQSFEHRVSESIRRELVIFRKA